MSNFIGDDNNSTNEDLFDVWSDCTSLNLSIKVNSKTEDKITLTISIE